MKLLTKDNIDEFMNYYHHFHDSYIRDLKYNFKESEIELLIDVFWCGEVTLKRDNTYEINKRKLKMYFKKVYQYKYKDTYADYIDDAYLKYGKIDNKEYVCFATDKERPLISIVCEEIEYIESAEDTSREDEIINIHQNLMDVYNFAKEVYKAMRIPAKLGYYNKHLLKLRGNYVEQDYYMPVISVEDKGDICFNFDEVSYEFYLTNEKLKRYLNTLLLQYKDTLSIYTSKNCDIDLYNIGDTEKSILKRLDEYSEEETMGITIMEKSRTNKGIVENFLKILNLFKEDNNE